MALTSPNLCFQINVLHKEWDSLSAEQEELQGYKTEVNAAVMRMKQAIAAKELDIEVSRSYKLCLRESNVASDCSMGELTQRGSIVRHKRCSYCV